MKKWQIFLVSMISVVVVVGGTLLYLLVDWNGGSDDDDEQTKLETVSSRYISTPVNEDGYLVDHSYTDGYGDYYFIYLGKVEWVPISSNGAKYYDGITPIKLTYSSKTVTSDSITNSITKAFAHTTQNTSHYSDIKTLKADVTFKFPFVTELSFEYGGSHTEGGSDSTMNQRSRTKTETTFRNWAEENSETIEFTIGNNREPTGYYRYALFATCDVYIVIIRDRVTNEYDCYYDFFARPNSLFEGKDYSAINFDDVVYDKKLEISDSLVESLQSILIPSDETWTDIVEDPFFPSSYTLTADSFSFDVVYYKKGTAIHFEFLHAQGGFYIQYSAKVITHNNGQTFNVNIGRLSVPVGGTSDMSSQFATAFNSYFNTSAGKNVILGAFDTGYVDNTALANSFADTFNNKTVTMPNNTIVTTGSTWTESLYPVTAGLNNMGRVSLADFRNGFNDFSPSLQIYSITDDTYSLDPKFPTLYGDIRSYSMTGSVQ